MLITVNTSLDYAAGVSLQLNGTDFYTAFLDDGSAVIEISQSSLTTDGSLNVIQARLLDENGEYIINEDGSTYGEYQNAVSRYVCF